MEKETLISIQQLCEHYNMEFSFIHSLHEYGLLEILTVETTQFIPVEKIKDIEKMMRMHYELDINLEGIDTITHLLNRIENMQNELTILRNRLSRLED
ncbi:MAG TPA: chaperone modulator CbpM [Cytophagaceae bacterium]|jgi:hypothetical protein|nr:chaperone modulator CbpM [Cytophagaceae bacterium]